LPANELISNLDDAEEELAERLDGSHYRDDVLRLLFICCHPDLPATQRITRAKRRVTSADVPFEAPGAVERAERVGAGAAERSQSRRPAEPGTSLGAIPGQPQSGTCRKEAPAETLAAGAAEVS